MATLREIEAGLRGVNEIVKAKESSDPGHKRLVEDLTIHLQPR